MRANTIAAALCMACAVAPGAAPAGTDAIAMAERGAALIMTRGRNEMIRRINAKDPDFVQGALHVGLRDLRTGIVLAHPHDRWIVGRNLVDVPDAAGKMYRREILELAASRGKGWVDYQYKNPASGRLESHSAYILRVGDVVLEAGW